MRLDGSGCLELAIAVEAAASRTRTGRRTPFSSGAADRREHRRWNGTRRCSLCCTPGALEQIKEECRDTRGVNTIVGIFQDLRYAARRFRRSPIFTITALVSLALGIGVNSAIFTAADAILWKPLPVQDPESLVRLMVTREKRHDLRAIPVAFADELQRSSTAFSGVAGAVGDGLSFSLNGHAERIMGEAVSDSFFNLLGVQTILGQGFSEHVLKGRWAAEVSYRFWKGRFGGDERVIGRTVHLNKFPFTIVGAPAAFYRLEVGKEPALWVPRMHPGRELRQMHLLSESSEQEMARVKRGVTLPQAEAATDAQFQQFLRELPPERRGDLGHIRLAPGKTGDHEFVTAFEKPLLLLVGLVGLVLLIACANVANMLLARATARQRELAVQASIGSGRARLIRQMLAENLLLWLVGGALGWRSHPGRTSFCSDFRRRDICAWSWTCGRIFGRSCLRSVFRWRAASCSDFFPLSQRQVVISLAH
ncbi:MAG: hypothetical protein DMG57_05340 [Acidobacteria bacterium]|nr:MAG: hypothetical protein DMG57_05340 [Acidobacteriota bacterium]